MTATQQAPQPMSQQEPVRVSREPVTLDELLTEFRIDHEAELTAHAPSPATRQDQPA